MGCRAEQLGALGLGPLAVQRRAQGGRHHRVHRGVYSLAPATLLRKDGWWMAAVLACGAVLSHRDAADLRELRSSARSEVDVTVPTRGGRCLPGIDVHRSIALTRADVTVVRGIPCTTIARTILDCAALLYPRQLERMFEQAEAEQLLDFIALRAQIALRRSRRGVSPVREQMRTYALGQGQTWSEMERDFKV